MVNPGDVKKRRNEYGYGGKACTATVPPDGASAFIDG
jgi:hypothetical protein